MASVGVHLLPFLSSKVESELFVRYWSDIKNFFSLTLRYGKVLAELGTVLLLATVAVTMATKLHSLLLSTKNLEMLFGMENDFVTTPRTCNL